MLGPAWVEYVHEELIRNFWPDPRDIGSKGVRDRGLLESAVGRPNQTVFGEDAYPSVTDKAAALFHSLVANHPFHDGNKRTAILSLHHFLLANSYFILLSNDEAYEAAKRTASYRKHGLSHDQVLEAIRQLLTTHIITFDAVRELGGSNNAIFTVLYDPALEFKTKIRSSSRNRLISPE